MSLNELKEYAKSIGLTVGNIGKEKLIAKIQETETQREILNSVIDDDDFKEDVIKTNMDDKENTKDETLVDSISSVIDDLDDAEKNIETEIENLPSNTPIRVKSITFGGLLYKSQRNNAKFRWNQIGAEEIMTIEQLNEMNNTRHEFLNRPMVVLMDERAIRHFRLTKVYENVAKLKNLKKVFASDMNTIKSTIDMAINVNMRDVLISKVSQMIKNKTLVDINVIRVLTEKLNFDFEEILEQVD